MIQFIQNMLQFIQDNIFSIMTAIIAIIALWQTHKQIKLSNKQYLFESRVKKYTLANGLIQLYEDNKSLLIPAVSLPIVSIAFYKNSNSVEASS